MTPSNSSFPSNDGNIRNQHPNHQAAAPTQALAMDTHELIENAVLDSMGLLDEQEQAQFEIAFRAAPPAIQAMVRREQGRLAYIDGLLPKVDAPVGLRAAVLDRVRGEIERVTRDLSVDQPAPQPLMLQSNRVSPLWRAASLGLLAASITFGILTFLFVGEYNRAAAQLRSDSLVQTMAKTYGENYVRDVLFHQDTSRVVLRRASDDFKGEASMWINPEWPSAKLFCSAMPTPEGKTFRVAVLDEKGNVVQVLREFTSRGGIEGIEVPLQRGTTGQLAVLLAGDAADVILCKGDLQM